MEMLLKTFDTIKNTIGIQAKAIKSLLGITEAQKNRMDAIQEQIDILRKQLTDAGYLKDISE